VRAAYDLYAETNPAFVSFLLYRFVKSYSDGGSETPHISLAYLAIPLALSQRLEPSFSSTNAATGFLSWLNRFPEVRIGLQQDIEVARGVTAQGLRATLFSQLLELGGNGALQLGGAKKPPENTKSKMSDIPKQAVSRAERLGKWMSGAGGPAAIFSALEVRP
jgi:hypothetical protein